MTKNSAEEEFQIKIFVFKSIDPTDFEFWQTISYDGLVAVVINNGISFSIIEQVLTVLINPFVNSLIKQANRLSLYGPGNLGGFLAWRTQVGSSHIRSCQGWIKAFQHHMRTRIVKSGIP